MKEISIKIRSWICLVLCIMCLQEAFSQACTQPTLLIRSGWDYVNNQQFASGQADPYWMVTQDDDVNTLEPRPANVDHNINSTTYSLCINSGSLTNTVNNWVCATNTAMCSYPTGTCTHLDPSSYGNGGVGIEAPRIFSYTFCIEPGTNLSDVRLNFGFKADDFGKVCLNGNYLGNNSPGCGTTYCNYTNVSGVFQVGTNVLTVSLYNIGGSITYFAFTGTLSTVSGTVSPFKDINCCASSRIIVGQKFNDANGNGVFDSNESTIPNWPIILKNSSGTPIGYKITDVYGNYFFNGLSSGSYIVQEGSQIGFYQTYPASGTHNVNLSNVYAATNVNFGNRTSSVTCCSSNFITVTHLQSYSATGTPTIYTANACVGAVFTATASCATATAISWNFGDGSPTVVGTNVSHSYTTAGTYQATVVAVGTNSCSNAQRINITAAACVTCCPYNFVGGTGLLNLTATGSPTVFTANTCPNTTLNLNANSCSSAGTFTWNFGDGSPLVFGTSATKQYTNQGSYTITVSAQGNGCYQKQQINVTNSFTSCAPCCTTGFVASAQLQNLGATGTPGTYTANTCPNTTLNLAASSCSASTSFTWSFGDGSPNQTGANVTKHYSNPGVYSMTVTASGPGCYQTQIIQVTNSYTNCTPCCNYSLVTGTGMSLTATGTPSVYNAVTCPNLTLNLNAASCSGASTFTWNFGDGSPNATGSSAVKNYSNTGNYVITLNASGANCYQTQIINVNNSSNCPQCCSYGFVASAQLQSLTATGTPSVYTAQTCPNTILNLNGSSCSSASSFTWNFSDGTSQVGANVFKQFLAPGNYSITVIARGNNCYQTQIIQVTNSYSNCPPCCNYSAVVSPSGMQLTATGTPSVYSGSTCPNLLVSLNATACAGASTFTWNFGDGSPIVNGGSVTKNYPTPGNYVITVNASGPNCYQSQLINVNNSGSCIQCCSTGFVTSAQLQTLVATGTPSLYTAQICPTSILNLSASSCTSATSYTWNFSDGSSQFGVNASKQFSTPGTFTIIAIAKGQYCYSTQTIVVTNSFSNCVQCCSSGFVTKTGLTNLSQISAGNYTAFTCVNSQFGFNASGCASATSFTINFGDGSSPVYSSSANHQYSQPGIYVANVTVFGNGCIASENVTITVYTPDPVIVTNGQCIGVSVPMSVNYFCVVSPGGTYNWDFGDGTLGSGLNVNHTYNSAGNFVLTLTAINGTTTAYTQTVTINPCLPPEPCTNCIGSFAPDPGDYILNVWVREDITPIPTTYANAQVQISFTGDPAVYTFGTNVLKNRVIDGWQRIEEPFTVPSAATHVNIKLVNNQPSGPDAYFDDIRIFPKDAQMKTYVYDPVTLKLSAILDENNYATFYEYDEEGKLLRVKKETEKGIMTIQENREALKK